MAFIFPSLPSYSQTIHGLLVIWGSGETGYGSRLYIEHGDSDNFELNKASQLHWWGPWNTGYRWPRGVYSYERKWRKIPR